MPRRDVPTTIAEALAQKNIQLTQKPLVIGGMAMEYYDLRLSGDDIDLVVPNADYRRLATAYPDQRKDIWGDLGVVLEPLEIWRSIKLFDYATLAEGAQDAGPVLIISPEKLLLTRAFFLHVDKYQRDFGLILQYLERGHRSSAFLADCSPYVEVYQRTGGTIYAGRYSLE